MTQQQLHTPDSVGARPIDPSFSANVGDDENTARVLDNAVPLQGASHADVVEYAVETPIRYAECFAMLADGRKVGLKEPRQFVGWSCHSPTRSLLFRADGAHLEVAVEERLRGHVPGSIRELIFESASEQRSNPPRKFIGVNGELVILPDAI